MIRVLLIDIFWEMRLECVGWGKGLEVVLVEELELVVYKSGKMSRQKENKE